MLNASLVRRFSLAVFLAVATFATVLAAGPDEEARLRSTRNCASCELIEADLQGVNAEGGDLSGANLTGANLYRAVLRAANLTGANLNNANLAGANLQMAIGADLSSAITNAQTVCPNGKNGPCQ